MPVKNGLFGFQTFLLVKKTWLCLSANPLFFWNDFNARKERIFRGLLFLSRQGADSDWEEDVVSLDCDIEPTSSPLITLSMGRFGMALLFLLDDGPTAVH